MPHKILISACLLGRPVRYDGKGKPLADPLIERWKPLAYTTVNTMLKKLHDRGLLIRLGRESNGYVYRAVCTRREYERAQTRAALAALEEQVAL